MLNVEKMMVLFSLTLLTPSYNTSTPLQPLAIEVVENKVNLNEFKPFRELNSDFILECKRQEELERLRLKQLELEKQKQEELVKTKTMTFTLTFYTSLDCENGYGAVTCQMKPLKSGMVANNVFSLGTKIHTKEFGTLIVSDRGGKNFDSKNRLDVFIPRNNGESDEHYKKRVNNMGIVKIKGIIDF